MKIFEVTNSPYLFHVTFTKNVPSIKEKGLLQFQPSNWIRGEGGDRYNEDAGIFAFTHPEDAFKWAFKMQWDMEDKDISIVRLNMANDWEDDPAGLGTRRDCRRRHTGFPYGLSTSAHSADFPLRGTSVVQGSPDPHPR